MIFNMLLSARRFFGRGILAIVLVLAGIAPVGAELVATPLRGDSRLVEFAYDADNTFLMLAKPLAVTHIQFGADELIQTVVAGDNANWEVTPAKNRKHLFVKPKYDGQETSMTVITDRRSYQFVLRSTGDGKKWYQRVSWVYPSELVVEYETREPSAAKLDAPQQQRAAAASLTPVNGLPGLRPEALRFNYEVRGEAPFRPLVVFDDGQFTYMKMPANLQELPALLAVTDEKEYGLVNFEVKGDYLVAHRLLPVAVLKLGRAEVRVQQVVPKRSFLGFNVQN